MILPDSVHRVGFPDVVGILSDVFVSSVASRDLIFVVVSQTVADLNPRRSIKSVFE